MAHFNSVSTLAIGAVLSTSLILGGCGDKNKTKSKDAIVKVETRKVPEADAVKALTALSLNESGSGVVAWGNKSGSAGNYTYSDLTIKGDKGDEPVKVGKLEILGAHMEGDLAAFDKITFFDMKTTDDDADVSFGELSLIKPSPALANAFGEAMRGNDDAFDDIEGKISFGGFNLVDMKVKSDDGNMVLGKMAFGEAKDKTGVFSMSGMDFQSTENGDNISMKLGSFETTGINIQKYKGLFEEAMKEGATGEQLGEETMQKIMSSMNPYDPDFKTMMLKDFNMNAEGVVINLDSYEGKVDKKGDKLYTSAKMTPLTITPPANSDDKDMQKFKDGLDTMGYDKLSLTMGGTSVLDASNDSMKSDDTYIELADGFKLSYAYDMKGYKAFSEQIMAAQGSGSNSNPMAMMGALSALDINDLEISFKDNSFVDRAFKLAAKEQGGTPEQLKQQAKMGLGFMGMMAKDEAQQKLATDFAAAASALIDNGGTLILKMDPAEDFDFATMMMQSMGGAPDISKMGISVSHK